MLIDSSLSLYPPYRAKYPFLETLQISEPVSHSVSVLKPEEQLAMDCIPQRKGKQCKHLTG